MDVIELLQQLIRNECVNDGTPDSGGEARSVATLQEFFGREGTVFEPHPGRASLVYRVPGSVAGAPTLMLMGHTDVVPAFPPGWSHDPFGGEIDDGFIWGRGAVDMLNMTAAMAAAFKPYLDGELQLPGDLVYFAVADEEAGGFLGVQWVLANHPEAVQCQYLLTEVAYPALPTAEGPAFPVTTAEKGPYWRKLSASGVPGHGSQPYGRENAVVDVGRAIARLADTASPVVITDEWRGMVEMLGLPDEITAMLTDPDRIDAAIEALQDPFLARISHALTHMTVSPNVVHGGSASNIIAEEGVLDVDIRVLPGQDEGTVEDHLKKALGLELFDRLEIEPVMDYPAGSSAAEGILWEAIGDGYEETFGSRRRFPNLISGTTDARFFRSRGVIAYSAGAFDDSVDLAEFAAMFHGHNERISLRSMELTTSFLGTAIARFGERSLAK
jgi:acetylornithine deacetylase/succinyl-diaminopimelate desuccinylase-like protein